MVSIAASLEALQCRLEALHDQIGSTAIPMEDRVRRIEAKMSRMAGERDVLNQGAPSRPLRARSSLKLVALL